MALKKVLPVLELNTITKGQVSITFSNREVIDSLSTTRVEILISPVIFHVVPSLTLFLFCLQDLDYLGIIYDNLRNILIQRDKLILIIRSFGYLFMLLDQIRAIATNNPSKDNEEIQYSYLTEVKLR